MGPHPVGMDQSYHHSCCLIVLWQELHHDTLKEGGCAPCMSPDWPRCCAVRIARGQLLAPCPTSLSTLGPSIPASLVSRGQNWPRGQIKNTHSLWTSKTSVANNGQRHMVAVKLSATKLQEPGDGQ